MEQVLQNLFHNALQYTPADSLIEVNVTHKDAQCMISIRDHGAGFPEAYIAQVFDKFFRLPHTKIGGSGLGLSIVKGFVEAHDGKVTLQNMPEGGAQFTIAFKTETSFLSNLKNE
jgi:two-component system sensor histidine kinase KdpD